MSDDVFDEDLMRELGIQPEDMAAARDPKKNSKPLAPATGGEAAQSTVGKAPTAKKPVSPANTQASAPGVSESSFSTIVEKSAPPPASKPMTKPASPTADANESVSEYSEKMTQNLPVQMAAVMAKKSLTLKEILELRAGDVVDFKKLPQDLIDLVVNGRLVARAELVLIDGKVGARIVKLVR